MRGALDSAVDRERVQTGTGVGAEQLDLEFIRLVRGPEALDLQPGAVLEADEPAGVVV